MFYEISVQPRMLSPPPALMINVICTYLTETPLSECDGMWLSRIDPCILSYTVKEDIFSAD